MEVHCQAIVCIKVSFYSFPGCHGFILGIQRGTCFLYSTYSVLNLFSNPGSSKKIKYIILIMKNRTAQIPMLYDENRIDSPNKTKRAPNIIGLRTCPYKPPVTSFLVGSHGASVPFPIRTNIRIVKTMTAIPDTINRHPIMLVNNHRNEKSFSIKRGTTIKAETGSKNEAICRIIFMFLLFSVIFRIARSKFVCLPARHPKHT